MRSRSRARGTGRVGLSNSLRLRASAVKLNFRSRFMFILLPGNRILNPGAITGAQFTEEPRELTLCLADGTEAKYTNHVAAALWGIIEQQLCGMRIDEQGNIAIKTAQPQQPKIVRGIELPHNGHPPG